MKNIDTTLYFITDSTGFGEEEFLCRVEAALKGGVTLLQLREKNKTTREYIHLAEKVHQLAKKYNVPLIIDDRIDVAMAVDAEGVHLGQSDVPVDTARRILGDDKIIGATAKTVEQALEAYKNGADNLGVGAIYPTTTKVKTVLTPVETLKEIVKSVPIPVNAIGGLNKDNMYVLADTGISGVCVVSAIMKAENPQKAAEEIKDRFYTLNSAEIKEQAVKKVLSVAGSDCSGGAGIQADIKTITMHGVYAMSAVTALTAQNTTGVYAIQESTPEFLRQQLDAVFEDIFPDAVKIGMVSSEELIAVIAERLRFYNAENIVVDPVMVASAGSSLIRTEAVKALTEQLLPMAALVTPNIPEAQVLADISIRNKEDMAKAAAIIGDRWGCAVLLKGGHSVSDADDLLYDGQDYTWFYGERIDNPNTHGTGCTLSSAIAANLALGRDIKTSIENAKRYISGALADNMNLGRGSGPLNHAFALHRTR